MSLSLTDRLPGPKERGGGQPTPAQPTVTLAVDNSFGIPKKKD
jgi:hypothetical protein